MADRLAVQAEAIMVQQEARFGTPATYTKKGAQTVEADGSLTSTDTVIGCTLVADRVTERDLAMAGAIEGSMRRWKGRASVLGTTGLRRGDGVSTAGSTEEVLVAELDPIGVTWLLTTREFQ